MMMTMPLHPRIFVAATLLILATDAAQNRGCWKWLNGHLPTIEAGEKFTVAELQRCKAHWTPYDEAIKDRLAKHNFDNYFEFKAGNGSTYRIRKSPQDDLDVRCSRTDTSYIQTRVESGTEPKYTKRPVIGPEDSNPKRKFLESHKRRAKPYSKEGLRVLYHHSGPGCSNVAGCEDGRCTEYLMRLSRWPRRVKTSFYSGTRRYSKGYLGCATMFLPDWHAISYPFKKACGLFSRHTVQTDYKPLRRDLWRAAQKSAIRQKCFTNRHVIVAA